MRGKWIVSAVFIVLILGPKDIPPQCEQIVFARANPGLCEARGGPFGHFGGGGSGGLLGGIAGIVHNLTGGLL